MQSRFPLRKDGGRNPNRQYSTREPVATEVDFAFDLVPGLAGPPLQPLRQRHRLPLDKDAHPRFTPREPVNASFTHPGKRFEIEEAEVGDSQGSGGQRFQGRIGWVVGPSRHQPPCQRSRPEVKLDREFEGGVQAVSAASASGKTVLQHIGQTNDRAIEERDLSELVQQGNRRNFSPDRNRKNAVEQKSRCGVPGSGRRPRSGSVTFAAVRKNRVGDLAQTGRRSFGKALVESLRGHGCPIRAALSERTRRRPPESVRKPKTSVWTKVRIA